MKVFVGRIPTAMNEGEKSHIFLFFNKLYKYHVIYTVALQFNYRLVCKQLPKLSLLLSSFPKQLNYFVTCDEHYKQLFKVSLQRNPLKHKREQRRRRCNNKRKGNQVKQNQFGFQKGDIRELGTPTMDGNIKSKQIDNKGERGVMYTMDLPSQSDIDVVIKGKF